jgi:hypothetical protein
MKVAGAPAWAAVVVGIVLLAGGAYILLHMSWRTLLVVAGLAAVIAIIAGLASASRR